MAAIGRSKKDHFWRRCYRKLAEMTDDNRRRNARHHSIRRWKNAQNQKVSITPVAFDYWATLTPRSRSKQLAPVVGSSNNRPRRTVSGAATAPASGCSYGRDSLSPQSYTTAKSISINSSSEEPRATLDPRSNDSFRNNMKFGRFNKSAEAEPSFCLGIMPATESEFSAPLCGTNGTHDDSQSSIDSGTFDSPSFENLINSFDWYATNVFKKLENSVLSFLNPTEHTEDKSNSAIDSTISPFSSGPSDSVLTPCTGAATKWDHAIDEAIYGHHAKCFI